MRKDKKFPSGRTIDPAPKLFIGGAELPSKGKPSTEKILGKIKNGVDFFQTQYVFEAKKLEEYMKVLGLIALSYSCLQVLDISYKELNKNKKFFEDKIETANFFFNRVLPRIDSHYKSATSGSKYIMDFKFN